MKIWDMSRLLLILSILLTGINCYGIEFLETEELPSIYHEEFYSRIKKHTNQVKDDYFLKAVKMYNQVYPVENLTVYKNENDKSGFYLSSKDMKPSPALSVIIFMLEKNNPRSLVEIFFIDTSTNISSIYSITGYVSNADIVEEKTFSGKPLWLYGTVALIYGDSSNFSNQDILFNEKSDRVSSLIFIPETNDNIFKNINMVVYPYLSVINMRNKKTLLITDRRILNYFNKYEINLPNTFYKYKGGGFSFKAFIYGENFTINKSGSENVIEISSVPVMFMVEKDKRLSRSYAYQKSPYKSLSIKSGYDNITVMDKPNGNEITSIDKTYYKSRDILYTPWNNLEYNGEVWYGVILPKISKTGYVSSKTVDIRNNERYER